MIHTFYGFSDTPFAKDIPAQKLLTSNRIPAATIGNPHTRIKKKEL